MESLPSQPAGLWTGRALLNVSNSSRTNEDMTKVPVRPATIALWSLAAIACGMTAFEGMTRADDAIRFGTPIFSSRADMLVRDADGLHGRPGARFRQFVLNNLGMRGPNVSPVADASTTRLVTLGASETFGLYEPEGMEFPRRLEACLNNRLQHVSASATKRVQVLNAGLPGFTIPTGLQDLALRLRRFGPSIALLYPSPPQYLEEERPRAAKPDSSFSRTTVSEWSWLQPRGVERIHDELKAMIPPFLATWLRRREIEQSLKAHGSDWRFVELPKDRLEALDHDLREFIGTARSSGMTPVLMVHVNRFSPNLPRDAHMLTAWEKFYPRATGEMIVAFDSLARETTLRVGSDSGAIVVDLPAEFPVARAPYFADFSHFTAEGADRVGRAACNALINVVTQPNSGRKVGDPNRGTSQRPSGPLSEAMR